MSNLNNRSVEISHLIFAYSKSSEPLLQINHLNVLSGEKVFIYGPSGSGKSTLLALLSGILTPNQGDINIYGESLSTMPMLKRDRFRGSNIGYIFQMFNLIPYLSVLENIILPIQISAEKKRRLTASPEDTARSFAERLGISSILDKSVTEISVGQQQRVAAARAFMGDPPIIIADEPTSSLDNDHRQQFCDLLLKESERYGATVLFVSHDTTLKSIFDRSIDLNTFKKTQKGS